EVEERAGPQVGLERGRVDRRHLHRAGEPQSPGALDVDGEAADQGVAPAGTGPAQLDEVVTRPCWAGTPSLSDGRCTDCEDEHGDGDDEGGRWPAIEPAGTSRGAVSGWPRQQRAEQAAGRGGVAL